MRGRMVCRWQLFYFFTYCLFGAFAVSGPPTLLHELQEEVECEAGYRLIYSEQEAIHEQDSFRAVIRPINKATNALS